MKLATRDGHHQEFEFPGDDWPPGDWLGSPGNEDHNSSKEILRVTSYFASATGKANKATAMPSNTDRWPSGPDPAMVTGGGPSWPWPVSSTTSRTQGWEPE